MNQPFPTIPAPEPRVLCVGDIVADIFASAMPSLPRPGELLFCDRIALFPGGNALNTAVALRRLGERVRFFGSVGDDVLGELLVAELERIGLDTGGLKREPGGATPTTLIYRAEGEDRRYIHTLGVAERFTGEDIPPELLPEDGVLLAAGYLKLPSWNDEALQRLFQEARKRGSTVVLNVCIPRQDGLDRQRCLRLLQHVDVFVLNELEACLLTGEQGLPAQARALRQAGARLVVITRGADGLFAEGEGCTVEMGAFTVPLVDPSGGGDCFSAGLIAAVLRGWDVAARLRFASAVGALGVTALGCTTGVPSFADVERFLTENDVRCEVSTGR